MKNKSKIKANLESKVFIKIKDKVKLHPWDIVCKELIYKIEFIDSNIISFISDAFL